MAAAPAATNLTSGILSAPYIPHHRRKPPHHQLNNQQPKHVTLTLAVRRNVIACKAAEVSSSGVTEDRRNWIPVVPLSALPKGERRVIIQDGETILLLWYKDEVFAIENRSPAEGAYSEGLINAKLTQVLVSISLIISVEFEIACYSICRYVIQFDEVYIPYICPEMYPKFSLKSIVCSNL